MRADSEAPEVVLAHQIAEQAHAGQVRLSGEPYINHVEGVADIALSIFGEGISKTEQDEIRIIAYLHDAIESKKHEEITLEYIARQSFTQETVGVIIDALDSLSRRDDIDGNGTRESYFDYIARVSRNRLARMVKMADIIHNLNNPIPFEKLMTKSSEALAKDTYVYGSALQILADTEMQDTQTAAATAD